jgi:DNA-binding transcriptional LysR family regulator
VPDDLKDHACLLFGAGSTTVNLGLHSAEQSVQVPIAAHLLVNDMDILHAAASAGSGSRCYPRNHCIDDLRAHRLERVLRDWNAPATPVHAVYPTARHLSAKVKSFVEHLQKRMTPPPWEIGPPP